MSTTAATVTANDNSSSINSGYMGFGRPGFRGCPRGMERNFGGFGTVQVSSEFQQNVNNIAKNDSDVQNLLNNGYNVTSVRPIISSIVDANGNVVTKATKAELTLQKDTTGRAFVIVDLDQAKVTKIVTMSRTIIEK